MKLLEINYLMIKIANINYLDNINKIINIFNKV